MDEKKAIDCLKNIIEYWTHKPTEVEAAKLAIDALEKQLADRWIPVSEGLPEEYGTYLVAWRPLRQNANDVKVNTESTLTHYYEILEFDPDDEAKWLDSIEQSYGEYVVIAWKPLPEPYQDDVD